MNDLISRSWLLDIVENAIQWDTERDRNLAIHHVRELTPSAQLLTEEDYIELHDRFGTWVEEVVRDMISGEGKRWGLG